MARFIHQDFETQSEADLTIVGGLKYNLDPSTRALLWSWALNDGPLKLWCPDLSTDLVPEVWAYLKSRVDCVDVCPPEVVEALKQPDTYIVGWNEAFDRGVWQQVVTPDHSWPRIEIEQTLDVMAQAQASNLPGQLEWAGRALGIGHKTVGGKAIMQRFARRQDPLPGSPADIENLLAKGLSRAKAVESAISAWTLYLDYSMQDTALMRDVWNCTRPLDGNEWQEYWVSERINDRGMLTDLDVCRGAVSYREEEALHVAAECERLTGGAINSPTLTKQINEWLYERLPEDLAAGMVKQRDEETGEATRLTGAKDVMTRLLEDIQTSDTPPSDDVTEFVELLQFGRSSSAVKFEKILNQEVDGRLSGSYVFNGAGQTGRYCLAAGSLVLVRNIVGVVEERVIEQVTPDDEVWDGGEWVTHEGVVFSGVKSVFEYDGVTATEDHQVFVSDTQKMSLREAAEYGLPIFKGTDPCTQYTR